MPVEVKKALTKEEINFGRLLLNRYWFLKYFWREELTIQEGRDDLPPEWAGKQIISVEQRMMMLDQSERILFCTGRKLGKCLAGDSVIYDAITGERMTIAGMMSNRPQAIATLDDWQIEPTSRFDVFPNETTRLYKVQTRAGLSIRVSANHPFLTGAGWVECSNLSAGDMIGVTKVSPMPIEDTSGLSNAEVALLAYLIGDGGVKYYVGFTNISSVIIDDFTSWVQAFDPTLKVRPRGKYGYAVSASRRSFKKGSNSLLNLLRDVGLFGKGSYDKFVPNAIFRLNKNKTSLFLSRLFATDGYVTAISIGYSSMSRRLIEDLHELLLRFGIFTRMYSKGTWAGTISHSIEICDSTDIIKFADEIGIFSKEEAVARSVARAKNCGPSKHDRMPLELVRATISGEGISPYMAGQNAGLRFKSCYQPSRDKVKRVATANNLDALMKLVDSDVYWDEIKSIKPDGTELTYDLSIDKTHNFVANGIVTHNSIILLGALVQTGILYNRDQAGEALLITPRDHHLAPLRRRLEIKIDKEPFFDIMIKRFNKSKGFVEFASGMTWWMRVEGQSGRGESQVSLRGDFIFGDEMAFGDQASHEARQQTAMPGSYQILAGVPNGVRNSPFYRLDQTSEGNSWSRHKYPSFINPLFKSLKVRKEVEESHGGVNTQSYITQVLGQWGKEAYSSFPKIPYIAALPYKYIELTEEQINANLDNLVALLSLPVGGVQAQSWILGGDLGYSPSPSVFIVCYLREGVWYQLARIVLRRCNPFNQARVIDCINCKILPEPLTVIMLDLHIWGSSVAHCLMEDPFINTHDDYGRKVIDANFAGRVEDPNIRIHKKCKFRLRMIDEYWWCDRCGCRVWLERDMENAHIPAKQHYTAQLKDALAYGDIFIGGDAADAPRPSL